MSGIDSSTSFLCHFDGTDGSIDFIDEINAITLTPSGNTQIDTDQSKFGGASALFDGNGDYISGTFNSAIGTSDFCIDFWSRPSSWPGSYMCIAEIDYTNGFIFQINGDTKIIVYTQSGAHEIFSQPITIGSWHHVAIARLSGLFYLYVDGTYLDSWSDSANISTTGFRIGARFSDSEAYAGHIDDLRLSSSARINDVNDPLYISSGTWSDGFTPPDSEYSTPPEVRKNRITLSGNYRQYNKNIISTVSDYERDTKKNTLTVSESNRSFAKNKLCSDLDVRNLSGSRIDFSHDFRTYRKTELTNTDDHRSRLKSSLINVCDNFTRHGYAIYADGTYQGFIDGEESPLTLENIILAEGYHKIEIRPSRWLWRYGDPGVRMAKTLAVNITASGTSEIVIPEIENLRYERFEYETNILWTLPESYNSDAAYDFGIWFSDSSPVDVSGDPDAVIRAWNGAGAYMYSRAQTEAEYVAVAARDENATAGSASELLLPWGSAPDVPQNQRVLEGVKNG